MAWFKILAGDFKKGDGNLFSNGKFQIYSEKKLFPETISGTQIASVKTVTEKNTQNTTGAMGAFISALTGGSKSSVTFVCTFADGRKFLGEGEPAILTELNAQVIENNLAGESAASPE
ncbi:MAG: hypothetical protein LBE15_00785 [Burkholderiales bacterium]|jgi:hypothetical protein|nr:hypothetical protein [Burkholderiales bacterium]